MNILPNSEILDEDLNDLQTEFNHKLRLKNVLWIDFGNFPKLMGWRHVIQQNDIPQNDIPQIDIQDNDIKPFDI